MLVLVSKLVLITALVGAIIWSASSRDLVWVRGFTVMNVLTGSMEPEIPQGSLIVINQVDPSVLQVGDDIAYFASENVTFTHRIINIFESYSSTGYLGFQMMDLVNGMKAPPLVSEINVVGRVVRVIPWAGNIVVLVGVLINDFLFLVLAGIFTPVIIFSMYTLQGKKKKNIVPEPVITVNTQQ